MTGVDLGLLPKQCDLELLRLPLHCNRSNLYEAGHLCENPPLHARSRCDLE